MDAVAGAAKLAEKGTSQVATVSEAGLVGRFTFGLRDWLALDGSSGGPTVRSCSRNRQTPEIDSLDRAAHRGRRVLELVVGDRAHVEHDAIVDHARHHRYVRGAERSVEILGAPRDRHAPARQLGER